MLSNLFWNILPLNLTILFKVLLRCSKLATGNLGSMWHCGFRLICFEIRRGNGPNPVLQNATVQSPTFRETRSFRHFLYSSINTAVLEFWLWFDSKYLISSFSAAFSQAGRVSINKLLRREVPKMKRPPRSLDPNLKILFLILTVLVKWCYAHFCCNESGGEVLCCRLPKFL